MTERLHFHFSFSCTGEGNGNPLQCSCLENPRDEGAWWAAIYGVTQSRTRLKWLSSSSSSTKMRSWHKNLKYCKETGCLMVKSFKKLEYLKMSYMFFSYLKKKKSYSKFLNFPVIKNACLAVFKHTHILNMSQCKRGILNKKWENYCFGKQFLLLREIFENRCLAKFSSLCNFVTENKLRMSTIKHLSARFEN